MKITLNDTITVSEDVVAREVGGEMVLLDLDSGQYFGLDAVGGRVWELLSDGPQTVGALCDNIESEFDAPRDKIEADLIALSAQLQEAGLLSAVSA